MKVKIIAGLMIILALTASSLNAQEFTLITTPANIISNKASVDLPGLTNNPQAIIVATPLGNTQTLNPHPIGAWYYANKWNIFNTDSAVMPQNAKFKIQFFLKPGVNQFLHQVTAENLGAEGSYIDNPALNNNPNAQVQILQNHAPDVRKPYNVNRFEAKAAYSSAAGRWYITNINGQPIGRGAAYNIVVAAGGSTGSNPTDVKPTENNTAPTTPTGNTGTGSQNPAPATRTAFDYDGDGKSDISIFSPAGGQWRIQQSAGNAVVPFQFGTATDKPVPADYDGDGKSDAAVFRPSTGVWLIRRSSTGATSSIPFGISTDIPAPGDFDGDGLADPAVFRPAEGTWYINKSSGGTQITQWGKAGDVPVTADYDGDRKADLAVFRPSDGSWWLNRSKDGTTTSTFGVGTDKPVPADYTGDGKADIAVWRPGNGSWYVLRSEDSSFYAVPFGASGDLPSPADYDGDGKADLAVFRPTEANWFIQRSTQGMLIQQFGANGDLPTPAAFVH